MPVTEIRGECSRGWSCGNSYQTQLISSRGCHQLAGTARYGRRENMQGSESGLVKT